MSLDDPCRDTAERFLAGELGPPAREAFLRHAQVCDACSGLVELDAQLRGAPGEDEALTVLEGDRLRALVMHELRLRAARPAALAPEPRVRLKADTTSVAEVRPNVDTTSVRHAWLARALPAAAAVVLMLGAGFAAGRLWSAPVDDSEEALAGRIQRVALQGRSLADIENSPYTFSNVTFRNVGDRRVALGFDVSTHVDLTAERSDPLVRELVVEAVLNPSPIGSRLEAISYAEGLMGSDVMKALQIAMLNDPSEAVQLKALVALAPYKGDPTVQSSLLTVLKTAGSVQMRLQAIDYLVESRVDRQAMRDALQHLNPAADAAVLVRAGAYIQ